MSLVPGGSGTLTHVSAFSTQFYYQEKDYSGWHGYGLRYAYGTRYLYVFILYQVRSTNYDHSVKMNYSVFLRTLSPCYLTCCNLQCMFVLCALFCLALRVQERNRTNPSCSEENDRLRYWWRHHPCHYPWNRWRKRQWKGNAIDCCRRSTFFKLSDCLIACYIRATDDVGEIIERGAWGGYVCNLPSSWWLL